MFRMPGDRTHTFFQTFERGILMKAKLVTACAVAAALMVPVAAYSQTTQARHPRTHRRQPRKKVPAPLTMRRSPRRSSPVRQGQAGERAQAQRGHRQGSRHAPRHREEQGGSRQGRVHCQGRERRFHGEKRDQGRACKITQRRFSTKKRAAGPPFFIASLLPHHPSPIAPPQVKSPGEPMMPGPPVERRTAIVRPKP